MTDTSATKLAADIPLAAARISMAAVIAYQLLLAALIFLRPDLDPSWHTISEWAIGPHGWVMTLAFFVSALSYGALFVTLKSQARGAMGRIGLGLLLVCVIGTAGVGTFTTDPMQSPPLPLTTRGTLHIVFGASALMLLPFAALLLNLSLARRNEAWRSARRVLYSTCGVPLFGLVSFVAYTVLFVVPLGPEAYGPGVNIGWPPRFALLTYAIWVIAVTSQAIKVRKRRA